MVARPDDLPSIVAGLLRRVADLETAERLTNAAMKNGRIRILDANDATRVELGTLSDWGNGTGDYGIAVLTPQGRPVFLVTEDDGQYCPIVQVAFAPLHAVSTFGFIVRDTTSYEDFARADAWITSRHLQYDLQVDPAAGTSAQWQITAQLEGTGSPVTLASGSVPSGSSAQQAGSVNLPSTLGSDAIGRFCSFRVQAKRTGGAGQIGVRFNVFPVMRATVV